MPLTPLPKRSVARSFWSTATTKCRSFGRESKLSTSVNAPCGVETWPSRRGTGEVEMQLEVSEPARIEELRVRLRVLHQRDDARRIGGGPDDGGREELEAHRLGDLLRAQHRAGRDGDAGHRTRASWSQTSAVAACAPWSR